MLWQRMSLTVPFLVLATVAAHPAHAQSEDPADRARFQTGPLSLAPSIRLTNIGVDTNVFRENDVDDPERDWMATASPSTSLWLRMRRVRFSGYSQFDLIYFNRLTYLRAVDSENAGRVQVALNRVTPYLQGNRTVTRHRRNLEIDAPVRRSDAGWTAGVGVRVTPKGTVDLSVQRHDYKYSGDTLYLGSDLARLLNRRLTVEGLGFRYDLTPLTTVGLSVARERNRFSVATDRDADSVRVRPSVEFKPFALVTGRAEVGVRHRRFVNARLPELTGVTAAVDLGYTLLGATQFGLHVERDLAYSYHIDLEEYVLSGLTVSAMHRLSEAWDVGGSIARYRLSYRQPGVTSPWEQVRGYSAGMGYRLSNSRVGVQGEYHRRAVDPFFGAWRGYSGLRVTTSLTYDF